MSDFGDTLMTQDLEASAILLNIWFFLMIASTTSAVIGVSVFSAKYRIPIILRYDFDCDNQRTSTLSASI